MDKNLELISKIGIVPVIKITKEEQAVPLAKALYEGGIRCAEVTFRTEKAAAGIKAMTEAYPDMLVGAGTVLTKKQVDDAIEAGAKFIVSPGLNPEIVDYCIEKGICITPGCANPSDVEQALMRGLDVVKFFPAEAAGGLPMLKAMAGPYVNVKFMPTGGINESNLTSYLDFDKIIACGGSWMVDGKLLEAGDYEGIKELAKKAVAKMLGFEVVHVGINMQNAEEADEVATDLSSMFGFEKKVGNSSIFCGKGFEIMKTPYLGSMGHVAIATNYMERAVYHLECQGYKFNMDSARYDDKGKLKAIYFEGEFGGFALHLVKKAK